MTCHSHLSQEKAGQVSFRARQEGPPDPRVRHSLLLTVVDIEGTRSFLLVSVLLFPPPLFLCSGDTVVASELLSTRPLDPLN